MKKKLIIIRPGKLGGVSDHTNILTSIFKKRRKVELIKINRTTQKIKKKFFNKSDTIILQYSGYGYATKGAPYWLIKEFISLKEKVNKIIIIFHELYAVSYTPWKSAFWFQFSQRYIFRKLLAVSDYSLIATKKNFKKYNKLNFNKKIIYLPTFSTIGESKKLIIKKKNIIIIFGLIHNRINIYKKLGKDLFYWAKKNKVQIIDIGKKITDQKLIKDLKNNNVETKGFINEMNIQKIFKKAKYGLLLYDSDVLDKSSVFNSYANFGIIPILIDNVKKKLIVKKDYQYLSSFPRIIINLDSIVKNNWHWYQGHTVIKTTNKISNLF